MGVSSKSVRGNASPHSRWNLYSLVTAFDLFLIFFFRGCGEAKKSHKKDYLSAFGRLYGDSQCTPASHCRPCPFLTGGTPVGATSGSACCAAISGLLSCALLFAAALGCCWRQAAGLLFWPRCSSYIHHGPSPARSLGPEETTRAPPRMFHTSYCGAEPNTLSVHRCGFQRALWWRSCSSHWKSVPVTNYA